MVAARYSFLFALAIIAIGLCVGQLDEGVTDYPGGAEIASDDDPLRPSEQRRPCNGTWSSWQDWSSCSASCRSFGSRTRERKCEPPRQPRRCRRVGADCPGIKEERRYCFGECVTQLPRISTRTLGRTVGRAPVLTTPTPRADECSSGNRQGGWGEWACWSPCTDRIRVRYRLCNRPKPVGPNSFCRGQQEERQSCDDDTTVCANGLDLVFAVDASGSIGSTNFNRMSNDLLDTLRRFNLDNNYDTRRARVGILTFDTGTAIVNELRNFALPSGLRYTGGGTNTFAAIDLARNQMFQSSSGDRPENPNVLVVLTDGRSSDRSRTLSAAARAKAQGIRIIAMGIGGNVDQSELRGIATNANTDVISVTDFNQLRNELNRVFRC